MPSVRPPPPPPPPLLLLDSTLPKGVRLGVAKVINIIAAPPIQHKQQLGLFATCGFEAGELIFQGQATLIDAGPPGAEGASDSAAEEEAPYALLTLRGDPAEAADAAAAAADAAASTSVHPIRLRRHTTRLPIGHTRLLHAGVASFMNHGCDPSTVVEAVTTGDSDGDDVVRYDVRAARRLEPGAELSCDYTLAEYDATEKGMDPCRCGAPAGVCLGAVRGFKYLPLQQQVARLGRVAEHLFTQFQADHQQQQQQQGAVMVIDARDGPSGGEGVFLDLGEEGKPPRLLTTHAVPAGAVLYEGASRLVRPIGGGGGGDSNRLLTMTSNLHVYPLVVLVVGPHALPLEPLALFSASYDMQGAREVYSGCDALMRHACGERATTTWAWDDSSDHAATSSSASATPYRVSAARALAAGEELTVDYRALAWRGLHHDSSASPSSPPLPAPALGTPGFCCDCCGRRVFR